MESKRETGNAEAEREDRVTGELRGWIIMISGLVKMGTR